MIPVPEVEKPRVTAIQVRIDGHGCVQKIKKALHGMNGIYDICIDLPQQKLTIIGWADPEKLVKAIKKSRKIAIICPNPNQPAQPPEPPLEGSQPPPEAAKPSDHPPPKASCPADPHKDLPTPDNPQPPKPENPQGEANPSSGTMEPILPPFRQQQDGDVFVKSWPNNYEYRQPWSGQPVELTAPFHMTHSYGTCMPFPYVIEYIELPAKYLNYYVNAGAAGCNCRYKSKSCSRLSKNIASIFSDENPHACRIL